ncbi:MAG: LL-diaminopimelate aminotransferase [Treponema sp.]|nr:LL-diaminopimelate aminotransferase [Treponema sp.]MCL2236851.1 LL-diaminopimelate aminotransferase [Treponema sp.]
MITRNLNMANLKAGYLFPEIAKRRREFAAAHPDAKIISLGVGNTTEPILPHTNAGLVNGAQKLGTAQGYSGYQDEGIARLREKISSVFYKDKFGIDEIFISDGAKCDIGRLQILFGSGAKIAVQDPSYPVYVDGSVLAGAAGGWEEYAANSGGYKGITYLPCTAENNFFPNLDLIPNNSVIYFCSPNNPTGAVADRAQLTSLVNAAISKGCLIVFDAAYSEFIRDPNLPKTIYEIDKAQTCAIEVNSFSKPAGFTGVRLGWSVVPKAIKYSTGESVNADWSRIAGTIFNGASNIAQEGGLASLDDDGIKEIRELTDFYLGNAKLIRNALTKKGLTCIGGENSPYIWAKFPGRDSWEVFSEILEKCHVVTTPGAGFGPAGQSFVRFSAFGHRADVEEACKRLEKL